MGEKTLRPKTVFVFDYGELIRLVNDSTIVINSILPLREDCLQVCFVPVEDMDESLKTTSLIHAAQTTAGGRELLYKYLDVVGERCIYNDTGKSIKKMSLTLSFLTNSNRIFSVFQIPGVFCLFRGSLTPISGHI